MTAQRDRGQLPQSASRGGFLTTDTSANTPARGVFVAMALNMAWQLAAVVLVPVLGGHFLDGALHTAPWLTIAGFALAAAGTGVVLWHSLRVADTLNAPKERP